MHSRDVYIIALSVLQLAFLSHGLSIINTGAGLALIGEDGLFGYISIALFVGLFGSVFSNVTHLVRAITETDMRAISRVAYVSIGTLLTVVTLQLLNALSIYNQYQ